MATVTFLVTVDSSLFPPQYGKKHYGSQWLPSPAWPQLMLAIAFHSTENKTLRKSMAIVNCLVTVDGSHWIPQYFSSILYYGNYNILQSAATKQLTAATDLHSMEKNTMYKPMATITPLATADRSHWLSLRFIPLYCGKQWLPLFFWLRPIRNRNKLENNI